MRDPFDDKPTLRLGAAPAKPKAEPAMKSGYGPGAVTDDQKAGLDEAWDVLGIDDIFSKAMALKAAKAVTNSIAETYGIPARLLRGPQGPLTATQKVDLDRFYARSGRPVGDGAVRYEPAPLLHPLLPGCRAVEPEVLSEEEFARRHPDPVPVLVYHEAATFNREVFDFLAKRPPIDHRPIGGTEEEWRKHLRANHADLVKKDPQP